MSSTPSWLAPWRLVDKLPLLSEAGPSHLAGVAMVFVAVLFAVILDRATTSLAARQWSGRPPWVRDLPRWTAPAAVSALAVVALAPIAGAIGLPATVGRVTSPGGLTRVIDTTPVGATVLLWPFPSALNARALVWQAEDDFRFSVVGGYGFAPGPGHAKLNAGNDLTPYGALAQVDVGPDGQPLDQQLELSREEIDDSGATEAVVVPVGVHRPVQLRPGLLHRPAGTGPHLRARWGLGVGGTGDHRPAADHHHRHRRASSAPPSVPIRTSRWPCRSASWPTAGR